MRILVSPRQLLAAARRRWATGPEPDDPPFGEVESCRECGCTELLACPGGCWWVARGLCSNCYPRYGGTD